MESIPHHVIYRSQGGAGTKRNGVTICIDCHCLAHTKKEVRKWFENFAENKFDENGNYKGDNY